MILLFAPIVNRKTGETDAAMWVDSWVEPYGFTGSAPELGLRHRPADPLDAPPLSPGGPMNPALAVVLTLAALAIGPQLLKAHAEGAPDRAAVLRAVEASQP